MLQSLLAGWDRRRTARSSAARAAAGRRGRMGRALRLESLELRQMMAVTLGAIDDIDAPEGRAVFVPLSGLDDEGGSISYQVSSSDPQVSVSLISPPGEKSLRLDVNGTDKDGVGFSGTLVIRLFDDYAPETVARITALVQQNFYNGLDFHRIVDGFMAQGGDNGTGGSGQKPDDEFDPEFTFISRGLLAMANAGRDTGDSQFFITAVDAAGSTNPIALGNMPQHLNFRHTIFGQLVSGFDTFEKIMKVNVQTNTSTGEVSKPVNKVTISSASIVTDTQNAVLRVSAPSGFAGDMAQITVTARNADNETSTQTFDVSGVASTGARPPYLSGGNLANKTTAAGTPVTFTLTSTDVTGGGTFYKVADATTFGNNANVTVSVNQQTGVVTLTPTAGFTGTITLKAGVRASSAADTVGNYDTETFTLTVGDDDPGDPEAPAAPTALAVMSSSTSGPFDGNGYVATPTPMLTVNAPTGTTVEFKMGTTVIATGVETATGSGVYRATLPAGKLGVGTNAITATARNSNGTSAASTALSVTYAPDYTTGVYVVPGAVGASQSLSMRWVARNAAFANEVGYFVADSASGAVGGVSPGSAGYAQAALNSSTRRVVFSQGESAGATEAATATGGQFLVFYMIQNNTTANFLSKNPTNAARGNNNSGAPLAFFSIAGANPDNMRHAKIVADGTTGNAQLGWEDLYGLGDSDFNDMVMRVSLAAQSNVPASTIHAPGAGTGTVKVNSTISGGAATLGDVGVFFVDGPNGAIGNLLPGSSGYAAAALASANSRVLFSGGGSAGATGSATVPAGKYLAFYTLSSGTTANFLANNPTNSRTGNPVAMFSFDSANPGGANHFSWIAGEAESTSPSATRLHVMEDGFGSAADVFALDLAFATS